MTDQSTTGHLPSPAPDGRPAGRTRAGKPSRRAGWLGPAGLIALSVVPMVAGAARMTELAGGPEMTAENARYVVMPLPVMLHIPSAVLFCVLGALQFAPRFRRRRPGWHRVTGRLLVPCGIVAAASGLWMTLFAGRHPADGDLLAVIRVMFGTAMIAAIVLGFVAIRRRDFARHRAWMIRGYAIGQGAGTQVLTHLPSLLIFGPPGQFTKAMLMLAGWLINIAVAEWIIRREPARVLAGGRRTSPSPSVGRVSS
ncbi:DUF2306 domain-containing protein [Sphaerisporangium corydalis]|uniref:DUF2306 domain-containing protein n=1 Tax=Sphaerisporangium corydalis TaxID=1441875 RepID=A0ABV9EHE0_9ACTN|nr:DUF2306 domain-containing protein [Sphaerisporangium corydalis]